MIKNILILLLGLIIHDIVLAQKATLKVNVGHSGEIGQMVFSEDGKYLYTSPSFGEEEIKIWDVATLSEIKTIPYDGGNFKIASNTEFMALTAGLYLKIYNSQNGEELRKFKSKSRKSIYSFDFSDSKKYIATSHYDSEGDKAISYLTIWDYQTADEIKTLRIGIDTKTEGVYFGKNYIKGVDFIPNSNSLLVTTESSIMIIDIINETILKSVDAEVSYHKVMGDKIYSSQKNGGFVVRDLNSLEYIKGYSLSDEGFTFAISRDGTWVAVAPYIRDEYANLTIIDIENGDVITSIENTHKRSMFTLEFDPKKQFVYGIADDGDGLKRWEVSSGKLFNDFEPKISWSRATLNANRTILNSHNNTLWSLTENKPPYTINSKNYDLSLLSELSISYFDESDSRKAYEYDYKNYEFKTWDVPSQTLLKKVVLGNGSIGDLSYTEYGYNHNYTITYHKTEGVIKVWSHEDGQLVQTINDLPSDRIKKNKIQDITIDNQGNYAAAVFKQKVMVWDVKTGSLLRYMDLEKPLYMFGSVAFYEGGNELYLKVYGNHYKLDTRTLDTIEKYGRSTKGGPSIDKSPGNVDNIRKLKYKGTESGAIEVWDLEKDKKILELYSLLDNENWVAITPEGYFDGTEKGIALLHYVKGMKVIPLTGLYEQYYAPNLIARVLAGEQFATPDVNVTELKLPPTVKITSPSNGQSFDHKEITVTVKATDQGGGIDEILLYHNGKLVETTQRGFKATSGSSKTFNVILVNGSNSIRATAFNQQRTESIPDEIYVNYNGSTKTAELHMLVIGVNEYKNPKYSLNYALPDAEAFAQAMSSNSNLIYNNTHVTFVKDSEVTKARIVQEFEKVKATAQQEDVFVFYFAGHGVMSTGENSQFHIVPHDVTKLYADAVTLNSKAISAKELKDFSTEISAQKQLFVFDACQSGGMTELLASRGAAEEKAIEQLARSTGTYWLTASGSEQFATEFAELKHGLFTYTLLLGLKGEADGGTKDSKITVKELSSYLDDKVPELSEKYKGSAQYPTIYGYGQDFPISIVK